jgi:NhaA family Na+:H+ antiporter
VLALPGKRVHPPPKIFLLTLAILDDPAAILIIPALHTAELKAQHLGMALIAVAFLAWLNWRGERRLAPYPPIGAARWFFVLKSGALATVAGAP